MQNEHELFERAFRKGVVLDANLLILYIVGCFDSQAVSKVRRIKAYRTKYFSIIASYLAETTRVLITPHVLTETCNLIDSSNYKVKEILEWIKTNFDLFDERHKPSEALMAEAGFTKFGLADSSIEDLCKEGFLAFTDDLPIYGYLANKGHSVYNFSHFREYFSW